MYIIFQSNRTCPICRGNASDYFDSADHQQQQQAQAAQAQGQVPAQGVANPAVTSGTASSNNLSTVATTVAVASPPTPQQSQAA